MKKWMKLLLYIIVNILISALTVFGVLWVWEKNHSVPCEVVPLSGVTTQEVGIPQKWDEEPTTQPDYSMVNVIIDGVFGAGQYDLERILIKNRSEERVNLHNWKIENTIFGDFIFPSLVLNEDGAVNVLTQPGNNTVIELFWGNSQSLWQPGDAVNLIDPNGQIHFTYRIP